MFKPRQAPLPMWAPKPLPPKAAKAPEPLHRLATTTFPQARATELEAAIAGVQAADHSKGVPVFVAPLRYDAVEAIESLCATPGYFYDPGVVYASRVFKGLSAAHREAPIPGRVKRITAADGLRELEPNFVYAPQGQAVPSALALRAGTVVCADLEELNRLLERTALRAHPIVLAKLFAAVKLV